MKIKVPRQYPPHPKQPFDGQSIIETAQIDKSFVREVGLEEEDFGEGSKLERVTGRTESTGERERHPNSSLPPSYILPEEIYQKSSFFTYIYSSRPRTIESLRFSDYSLHDLHRRCFRTWVRSEFLATMRPTGDKSYNKFLLESFDRELTLGPRAQGKDQITFDPTYSWVEHWNAQKKDAYYYFGWRLFSEIKTAEEMLSFLLESQTELSRNHPGELTPLEYTLFFFRTLLADLGTEEALNILGPENGKLINDSTYLKKLYDQLTQISVEFALIQTLQSKGVQKNELVPTWPYLLPVHNTKENIVVPTATYLSFIVKAIRQYIAELQTQIPQNYFINAGEITSEARYLIKYLEEMVMLFGFHTQSEEFIKIKTEVEMLQAMPFDAQTYDKRSEASQKEIDNIYGTVTELPLRGSRPRRFFTARKLIKDGD